jgi:hypothetical protein
MKTKQNITNKTAPAVISLFGSLIFTLLISYGQCSASDFEAKDLINTASKEIGETVFPLITNDLKWYDKHNDNLSAKAFLTGIQSNRYSFQRTSDINKNGIDEVVLAVKKSNETSFYLLFFEIKNKKYSLIKYFKYNWMFVIINDSNKNEVSIYFQDGTDWIRTIVNRNGSLVETEKYDP